MVGNYRMVLNGPSEHNSFIYSFRNYLLEYTTYTPVQETAFFQGPI